MSVFLLTSINQSGANADGNGCWVFQGYRAAGTGGTWLSPINIKVNGATASYSVGSVLAGGIDNPEVEWLDCDQEYRFSYGCGQVGCAACDCPEIEYHIFDATDCCPTCCTTFDNDLEYDDTNCWFIISCASGGTGTTGYTIYVKYNAVNNYAGAAIVNTITGQATPLYYNPTQDGYYWVDYVQFLCDPVTEGPVHVTCATTCNSAITAFTFSGCKIFSNWSGNCSTGINQWQFWNGSSWDDIVGENSASYTAGLGVGDYRVIRTGCVACTDSPPEVVSNVITMTDPLCDDPTPCTADPTISGTCILTSSIAGLCTSPVYQWQENNGATWQDLVGETNSSYTAVYDNQFRVRITNCENCGIVTSNIIDTTGNDCTPPVDGCVCTSLGLSLDVGICELSWSSATCSNYTLYLQYSVNGVSGWADIESDIGVSGNHSPVLNGFYRVRATYTAESCEELFSNVIEVLCIGFDPCAESTLAILAEIDKNEWCASDGLPPVLSSTVTPGVAPYTFEWKNPSGTVIGTTEDNVTIYSPQTGYYTVKVIDDDGCEATSQVYFTFHPDTIGVIVPAPPHCLNDPITLVAINYPAGSTFIWDTDGGSGTGLTTDTAIITWASTGVKQPSVQVTTLDSCVFIEQVVVTVQDCVSCPNGVAIIAQITDNNWCDNEANPILSSIPSGGNPPYVTFEWKNPSGTVIGSTEDNVEILNPITGDYQVTVTDSDGCQAVDTVALTATPDNVNVNVSFGEAPPYCIDDEIVFRCTGAPAGSTYFWVAAGGTIISGQGTAFCTISWAGVGLKTISCTVTTPTSCVYIDVVQITISQCTECPNGVSIDLVFPNFICASIGSTIVNATITGGTLPYDLIWTAPNSDTFVASGGSTSIRLPTDLVLMAGIYTVDLTDGDGCTDTLDFEITLSTMTGYIDQGNSLNICQDDYPVTLTTTINNPGGPVNYLWVRPDSSQVFTQNLVINDPAQEGVYSFLAQDGACSVYDTITIAVPTARDIDFFQCSTPCVGGECGLSMFVNDGLITNIVWSSSDGSFVGSVNGGSVTFVPSVSGNATVYLNYTYNGCPFQDSYVVTGIEACCDVCRYVINLPQGSSPIGVQDIQVDGVWLSGTGDITSPTYETNYNTLVAELQAFDPDATVTLYEIPSEPGIIKQLEIDGTCKDYQIAHLIVGPNPCSYVYEEFTPLLCGDAIHEECTCGTALIADSSCRVKLSTLTGYTNGCSKYSFILYGKDATSGSFKNHIDPIIASGSSQYVVPSGDFRVLASPVGGTDCVSMYTVDFCDLTLACDQMLSMTENGNMYIYNINGSGSIIAYGLNSGYQSLEFGKIAIAPNGKMRRIHVINEGGSNSQNNVYELNYMGGGGVSTLCSAINGVYDFDNGKDINGFVLYTEDRGYFQTDEGNLYHVIISTCSISLIDSLPGQSLNDMAIISNSMYTTYYDIGAGSTKLVRYDFSNIETFSSYISYTVIGNMPTGIDWKGIASIGSYLYGFLNNKIYLIDKVTPSSSTLALTQILGGDNFYSATSKLL